MANESKPGKTANSVNSSKPANSRRRPSAKSENSLPVSAQPVASPRPAAAEKSTPKGEQPAPSKPQEESLIKKITGLPGAMAGGAMRWAAKTTEMPLKVGKALFLRPDQSAMMEEAGRFLKDLREVAGLTLDELAAALDLKDRTLLEAVENGTATLSFELILRLAAVLARHDPVPVVLKFARTYNPELWKILEDWGFGRLSLNFEREREFINIFRRHDAARRLSNEGFARVLDFTRAAFEMSLHFVAEQEQVKDQKLSDVDAGDTDKNDPPT